MRTDEKPRITGFKEMEWQGEKYFVVETTDGDYIWDSEKLTRAEDLPTQHDSEV